MINQHDEYMDIKQRWIKNSKLIVDFEKGEAAINEWLYTLLGKPKSVGIFYNDDNILLTSNGAVELRKSELSKSKVSLCGDYISENIKFLFKLNPDKNVMQYKLVNLLDAYYFYGAEIRVR